MLQKVINIAFKYYASLVWGAKISKSDVIKFLGRVSFHLYICLIDSFPEIQEAFTVTNGENVCWGHINVIYWNLFGLKVCLFMNTLGLNARNITNNCKKFNENLHTSFVTLQMVKSERLKGLNFNVLISIFWFINTPLELKMGRNVLI